MPELVRITAPAVEPVTLAEVKAHCAIDDPAHDGLLAELIAAATGRLDGAAGLLGRCLITQAWRYTFARFPSGEIILPLPPCQSVDAITYTDPAGAAQVLPAADYRVSGLGGTTTARIRPAPGTTWPSTGDDPEAVAVSFTAGYGAAPAGRAGRDPRRDQDGRGQPVRLPRKRRRRRPCRGAARGAELIANYKVWSF